MEILQKLVKITEKGFYKHSLEFSKKSTYELILYSSNRWLFYICKALLFPIIKEFKPDLIYVSAGFDSCRGDPLGGLDLLPEGYAYMID